MLTPPLPDRRLIAVALGEPTTDQAHAALQAAARLADIVELRIDLMQEASLPRLLADRPCPVIVTCRAAREGGQWADSEERRLDVLRAAIDLGADFVDVEGDAFAAIRERGQTRLIASSHDFSSMPGDVPERYRALAATGAEVVKIVGMARDARDVLPIERVLAEADRPTIAIAMGEAGLASRVLALRHPSCLLTFCALETGGGTAPGQIGAAELVETYGARSLTRATDILGLLGSTVDGEALRRWNGLLRADGRDVVAVPLVVPEDADLPAMLDDLAALAPRAYLVEQLLQEAAAQVVDGLEPSACRAGRVNLIEVHADRLVGGWVDDDREVVERLYGSPVGGSPVGR
jgi:3-dehydroquinate dehydratase/shikimate dehydrogenase